MFLHSESHEVETARMEAADEAWIADGFSLDYSGEDDRYVSEYDYWTPTVRDLADLADADDVAAWQGMGR